MTSVPINQETDTKTFYDREIWRRYVYPVYGRCERTFYNLLNASCDPKNEVPQEAQTFLKFDFDDEPGHTENYPQYPKRR